MKLIFVSTLPIWLIFMLFIAISVLTIYLYGKHQLNRPWSILLPGARILAIALLLLSLLQPVLAHYYTTVTRGRIPILVDTSGSMTVTDKYPVPRQVRIAASMHMFDPSLRNTTFESTPELWTPIHEETNALSETCGELKQHLSESKDWDTPFDRKLRTLADELESQASEIEDLLETVAEGIEDSEFLKAAKDNETRGAGYITIRYFNDIPNSIVRDLTNHDSFTQDKPSEEGKIETFESKANRGDNYGTQIRGYIAPPQTGEYIFMMNSDDEAELYLSPDENPENKRRIIHVPNANGHDDWNRRSPKIQLESGQMYYIEALHKEGSGEDYIRVGWRMPDDTEEKPIKGDHLIPEGGLPPGTYRFWKLYATYTEDMTALQSQYNALAETLDTIANADTEDKNKDDLTKTLDEIQKLPTTCEQLNDRSESLQDAVDYSLAFAKIEPVDNALKELKEMDRMDLLKFALADGPFDIVTKLQEKGEAEVFEFKDLVETVEQTEYTNLEGKLASTRIGSAIHNVLKHYEKQQVGAVVVLTDGNHNSGRSLPQAKTMADDRTTPIPILGIGIGSTDPPDDVAVGRVLGPRTSFKDDDITLNITLKRHGYTDRPIKLKIKRGDEVVHEETVEPGEDDTVVLNTSFKETKSGMLSYTAHAELFPGENLDHNNEKSFEVNVLSDRVRTIQIDEYPRWESRYVNMMLKRDRRVDLTTIFVKSMKPGILKPQNGTYPQNRDDLFGYDLIVMGDVNPDHFSTEQLEDLAAFVEERGGTMIMVAGEHNMPARFQTTPLSSLLPIQLGMKTKLDPQPTPKGRGSVDRPLLTSEVARFDDLIQIARTPDTSSELWRKLPGMNWVRDRVAPLPSADTLISTREKHKTAVMIRSSIGLGNVMYVGSDAFWRWRYKVGWKYHHRFWGQIMLWATIGRTAGNDPHIKLMTDRPVYAPEELVTIKARLFDKQMIPLQNATGSAEIYDEDDKLVKTVPMIYVPNSGGSYQAQVPGLPKGKYRVVPQVLDLDDIETDAEINFEMRDLPTSEYVELAMDEAQIKQVTHDYWKFEDMLDLLEEVPVVERTHEHRLDTEIWDTFWFILIVAALLAFEWQTRKRVKLV